MHRPGLRRVALPQSGRAMEDAFMQLFATGAIRQVAHGSEEEEHGCPVASWRRPETPTRQVVGALLAGLLGRRMANLWPAVRVQALRPRMVRWEPR